MITRSHYKSSSTEQVVIPNCSTVRLCTFVDI